MMNKESESAPHAPLDLIGDIHGHYDKLKALLRALGYRAGGDTWRHPEGRRVVFLGDSLDRVDPAVVDLRLRICHSSRNWKTGDCLVQVLRCSFDDTHRTTCAQYLHDRAVAFIEDGDVGKAKETVKDAISLWQPIRYAMVGDERLDGCL